MNKMIKLTLLSLMLLPACGPSQKQLRAINDLLEKSKTVDCVTIHDYLNQIQAEIQKRIK